MKSDASSRHRWLTVDRSAAYTRIRPFFDLRCRKHIPIAKWHCPLHCTLPAQITAAKLSLSGQQRVKWQNAMANEKWLNYEQSCMSCPVSFKGLCQIDRPAFRASSQECIADYEWAPHSGWVFPDALESKELNNLWLIKDQPAMIVIVHGISCAVIELSESKIY